MYATIIVEPATKEVDMGWTFVALENPQALLQYKKKGKTKFVEDKRWQKYEDRKKFLKDNLGRLDEGQLEDDVSTIERFGRKSQTIAFARVTSLKHAIREIASRKDSYSGHLTTLIFVGHGSGSSMSVGLGMGPIGQQRIEDITSKERTRLMDKARDVFQINKRMIGFSNLNDWIALFAQLIGVVGEDTNGYFNLFLVGCSTGEWEPPQGQSEILLEFVARNLAELLDLDVAVFGLTNTIGFSKTEKLFDELDAIKDNVGGEDYALGNKVFVTSKTA